MTRMGPMCQVQFSTARSGKKIRWTQTRRLTVGTLVALSPASDGFKTICMPAIISDHRIRDGLDQSPPTIHFQWANPQDAVMDPTQELVMIEPRYGYFEAVRHTMVGLQHVASTESPLDKYLVQGDKSDLPAKYVRETSKMDISSLIHHAPDHASMESPEVRAKMDKAKEVLRSYAVLDGFDARLSKYTNLDNSQLSAVHRILTKELAIVQGPPGTGKTFTSVQALQILLRSQKRGSNVIVVAAQTNHAVDQILTQMINAGFGVVRLGGRTQNEDIKRYSMYNLRKNVRPPSAQRADREFKTFETARRNNVQTVENMIGDIFPGKLIEPEVLHAAGLISGEQLHSLRSEESWAAAPVSPDVPTGVMAEWLGIQLTEVSLLGGKDPDFDTVEEDDDFDIDVEDYDLDLDDCIDESGEDVGRVEGKFLPIQHLWTGKNPFNYTEHDYQVRQELRRADLWTVDLRYRGAIYQYWQKQLMSRNLAGFRQALADSSRIAKNLKISRWYKDTLCIKAKQIEIIGCTTTGLCKYRGLLAALKPRTMLIEEAAETWEANIVSALYGSLQQLVLVGDHQQLAPHCDTPALARDPYNMRVSMFERLVKLKMPFTVLNMQRRMIPSLREILNPFYPNLKDHPVVTSDEARPPIPGMAVPSFFFHHTWGEDSDDNASRFNILEAEMIVGFVNYLLMNGVETNQITILTFYRGQKKTLQKLFRTTMQHWGPFTNILTVDSYQGEENDIILLSLVRSGGQHGPHRAGFLQDKNRGVVSISRARRGMYIFGNMINLTCASTASYNMWKRVHDVFLEQNRFGGDGRLPITCQNHEKTTWKTHPEDWVNFHGGCDLPCQEKLTCGHTCGRRCHWLPHDRLICPKPCERRLVCGHRCQQVCGEPCKCSCPDFTGAYAGDKFPSRGQGHRDGPDPVYDRSQAALPVAKNGHDAGQGKKQYRGRESRFPQAPRPKHDNDTPKPKHGLVGIEAVAARQQVNPGNGFASFDARKDDAQRMKEARERAAAADRDSSGVTAMIHDVYKPVTIDGEYNRKVGEAIVTRAVPLGSTLPEKSFDLLSLPAPDRVSNGTSGTNDRAYPNNAIGNVLEAHSTIFGEFSPHAGTMDTVPRHFRRPGAQGFTYARTTTAVRQADKPEWETASTVADAASVCGDGDQPGSAETSKEEDLMVFI